MPAPHNPWLGARPVAGPVTGHSLSSGPGHEPLGAKLLFAAEEVFDFSCPVAGMDAVNDGMPISSAPLAVGTPSSAASSSSRGTVPGLAFMNCMRPDDLSTPCLVGTEGN